MTLILARIQLTEQGLKMSKIVLKQVEEREIIVFQRDSSIALDAMVETMERFLRACGYEFEGYLGIISEETCVSEETDIPGTFTVERNNYYD